MTQPLHQLARWAAPPWGLLTLCLLYGGMVCIAGVLGAKQVAFGGLSVEAGIFPFIMLLAMGSSVAEVYGRSVADRLVLLGFIPMLVAMGLIAMVLALPADPDMYPPLREAFPIVLGQNWRLMAAGLIAYGTSQIVNLMLFTLLGRGQPGRVGVRGAFASTISQIIDTLIFITIAFYGLRPIAGLILGQMLAKIALSIILVPVLIKIFIAVVKRMDG